MSYRVLVLPEDGVMSPAVLGRIRELVAEGGVVSGTQAAAAPRASRVTPALIPT